jgi:hypothetical protein
MVIADGFLRDYNFYTLGTSYNSQTRLNMNIIGAASGEIDTTNYF